MHRYHYSASFRVWHPSMEPALISKAIGLEPKRSWRAGEPRTTPKGQPLEGKYPESYWCADISGEAPEDGEQQCLEDFLLGASSRLSAVGDFLRSVRETGGRTEIFVGLYGRWNYGFEFSPNLLLKLSSLGLALSLDVYPNIEGP